jgi:hypothetical protein
VHHHAYHGAELLFSGDAGGIGWTALRTCARPPHRRTSTSPPGAAASHGCGRLGASLILPAHFGGTGGVAWHLDHLEARLADWDAWSARELGAGADLASLTDALRHKAHAEVVAATGSDELAHAYEAAVPTEMMAAGLVRWHQARA